MSQRQVYKQAVWAFGYKSLFNISKTYSCVEPDTQSENSFYRDPSLFESCDPSLPGTDDKDKSKRSPNKKKNT